MSRIVLDTSILIADEQGRGVAELPEGEAAISVVTLAELELGVHLAEGPAVRARRLATLHAVRELYAGLPIDDRVASAFAELVASLRRGRRRAPVQDTWIAATAVAHDAGLCTQDADFDALAEVSGLRLIRV